MVEAGLSEGLVTEHEAQVFVMTLNGTRDGSSRHSHYAILGDAVIPVSTLYMVLQPETISHIMSLADSVYRLIHARRS